MHFQAIHHHLRTKNIFSIGFIRLIPPIARIFGINTRGVLTVDPSIQNLQQVGFNRHHEILSDRSDAFGYRAGDDRDIHHMSDGYCQSNDRREVNLKVLLSRIK